MASTPGKTDDWPTSSPTTPHSFKIISEDNIRDGKLVSISLGFAIHVCCLLHKVRKDSPFLMRVKNVCCSYAMIEGIPNKFVMKYGNDLSSGVYLKLPRGSEWKIELRKWGNEVWFDKGWPEFSEFYSLHFGHWLSFGYEGESKFQVCIFDRSATEIKYPLTMPKIEKNDSDDDSDHDSKSSLSCPRPHKKNRTIAKGKDDFPANQGGDSDSDSSDSSSNDADDSTYRYPRKTREKPSLPCPRPHKKNRTSSSGRDDFPSKTGGEGTSSTRRFVKRRPGFVWRMSPLTNNGKAIARDRAEAFKAQHPSSFLVAMTHTYVNQSNLLGMCVFVLINNDIKPLINVVYFCTTEVENCTTDGEQTEPEEEDTDEYDDSDSGYEPNDESNEDSSHDPSDGPSDDAFNPSEDFDDDSDNDSFETPETFTSSQRKTRQKSPLTCPRPHKKTRTISSGKVDFKSEHPFFEVSMRKTYVHSGYLDLPNKFFKKHLKQLTHDCFILRVLEGRTWAVKLKQCAKGRARFYSGWSKFVGENSLEINDVCIFVLIKSIKPSLDVVFHCTTQKAAKRTLHN